MYGGGGGESLERAGRSISPSSSQIKSIQEMQLQHQGRVVVSIMPIDISSEYSSQLCVEGEVEEEEVVGVKLKVHTSQQVPTRLESRKSLNRSVVREDQRRRYPSKR